MKYIIIFLLFVSFQSIAQYQSVFGETSTSWNVFQELCDGFDTDSLYVTKDTSINDVTYKMIGGETLAEIWFIRESDNRDSVLFLNPELSDSEFIVMDLTLEVSDTFRLGPNLQEECYVDSVFVYEGKKHIRFSNSIEFAGGQEHFMFIEGVGTNFGLFYQGIDLRYVRQRHYLLCAYQDEILQYSNKSFDGECYVFWTKMIDTQQKDKLIDVYPNPVSENCLVTVNEDNFEEIDLLIYNSVGSLLKIVKLTSQHESLDISDIPTGLY
jgi:hypothetical protein